VKNGTNTYTTGYTYAAGTNGGNTTGLIADISQPGESCAYTYDNNGNILTAVRDDVTVRYTYDKLNPNTRCNCILPKKP